MLQLSQRPLSSSRSDADLFVGRQGELERAHRALDLGFNTYVQGASGSGKTTFLRRLDRELEERSRSFIAPDLASVLSPALLGHNGAERDGALAQLPVDLQHWLDSPEDGQPRDRHLVMLDGAESDLLVELFGRGRDELWELPLQWIVTGRAALAPPADSFFETVVSLAPMEPSEAAELLRRRAETGTDDEAALLAEIADALVDALGASTPRNVLAAARSILLADDANQALAELTDRQDARHQVSSSAGRLLSLLAVTGPAYAGDERLLKEMGMTRSRIVQLFGELETAGLLVAERAGKRKLYRPAPFAPAGTT